MKTYFKLEKPGLGLSLNLELELTPEYLDKIGAADLDLEADFEPMLQAVLEQFLPSNDYVSELDYPIRYRVKRFKTLMARLAELKPKSEEPGPNSEAKPAQLEQPILEQNINGEAKHD